MILFRVSLASSLLNVIEPSDMASRSERKDDQIKEEANRRTSTVITIAAIIGLVACSFINAVNERGVPDVVFWILGAAIVPDAIKWFLERKS